MSYKNARNKAAGTKQPETHSEEIGQETGQNAVRGFEGINSAIADQIVDLSGAQIVQEVIGRLSTGDFGRLAPAMLKSFETGALHTLGEEVKALREWHERPVKALPPADK
ncbi:hypothetical protein VF14_08795 [Nostoc linckia z18]|uniref:Uncharacterized protein n=2 Tax=Nostoc linckia TaxID=92942 RepID=A0A9Q5ZE91_NOSLI|nr:hypothetical protein [Nostoc linckia]PHK42545.1 hypothetical protein VF12_02440 [Nostoc linckia z15]PHK44519.1 hypothetical protein VF13_21140 [Nostoc linckia z16]PHJ59565.1 hypothetical protein VF02_24420 [Nostoc linckia z1]PHJ65158.1 hypothetical protein VF05_21730 [Nostoc linckia z3]PHJ69568.1 hypothetical protein VF03_23500 [Nostoc linckia z2]